MTRPTIAIVGRPNVGKSTLFNRLVGARAAIVEDRPGVTRDRNYGDGEFLDRGFVVIDTGGFEPETDDRLLLAMREQAEIAISEADVIIALFDGRAGLLPSDVEIVRMLERVDTPVHYAVNKIDGARHEPLVAEFWELGVEQLWGISAQHSSGVYDLMEAVVEDLPVAADEPELPEGALKVAIVGKPNAGKSTLLNRLLGEERLLVSDIPGTTRDSIDAWVERPAAARDASADDGDVPAKRYLMIDTAGVRRRKWIKTVVEKISVVRTFKSIDRADVCVLLIDATEGVTDQDAKIARMISDKGKGCVLLLNKWDAVSAKDNATHGVYIKAVRESLSFVAWAPILTISALQGQRVHKIFDAIDCAGANHLRRVPTGELNRALAEILQQHTPPVHRNRRLKFYYATQVSVAPPTLVLWVNDPDAVQESYLRFLKNRLRKEWDFEGTPLRLAVRARAQKDRDKPGSHDRDKPGSR